MVGATIRKEIELLSISWNTSSSTYQASNGQSGLGRMNKADYDPITAVYFEVGFEAIGTGGGDTVSVQLYDHTNSAAITGSTRTTNSAGHQRWRSGNILSNLAAGIVDYRPRWKANADLGTPSISIHTARLIIIQTGVLKKTVTHFMLGDKQNTASTSFIELSNPGRHKHTTGDYDETVTYEWHVCCSHVGFDRPRGDVELWDLDATVQEGVVFTPGATPAIVTDTAGITPTSGNILTIRAKINNVANTCLVFSSHFVVKQTSVTAITKTVSNHTVMHGGFVESDNSYDLANRPWGSYDPSEYTGVTKSGKHETTIRTGGAGTGYINISEENGAAAAIANSEVNHNTGTNNYEESSAVTLPTQSVDLFQDAYNASGSLTTANSRLNIFLTNIQGEGRRRSNIS